MANITRIKAKDSKPKNPPKKQPETAKTTKVVKKVKTSPANPTKKPLKKATSKKTKQPPKTKKSMPKWLAVITWPFRTIAKPFAALGRYIKASWREIRQVRWPNRKATWKMTGAILIYSALILSLILLLDALFTFIFNNILGS